MFVMPASRTRLVTAAPPPASVSVRSVALFSERMSIVSMRLRTDIAKPGFRKRRKASLPMCRSVVSHATMRLRSSFPCSASVKAWMAIGTLYVLAIGYCSSAL
jgi:hypothetical protein